MSGPWKRKALRAVLPSKRITPSLGVHKPVADAAGEQQSTRFVNLYTEPPHGEIDMEQFEQCAKNRRRVLQGIEDAQAKGVKQKDMQEYIEKLLRQHMPEPRSAAEAEEARATDNTSHFILRMAYSRTAALRKWFVRQEEVLFRYRFNRADDAARLRCMLGLCMLGLQPIGQAEFAGLEAELRAVFGWRDVGPDAHLADKDKEKTLCFKDAKEQWTHIFKVPFEEVPDLVRCRRVFLQGGWAYVLSSDAASVAATAFRQRLARGLLVFSDHYHENIGNEEDERLAPLMHSLPERAVGLVYGSDSTLALHELPGAMQASAPPCMRRSYAVLRTQHHLKHGGRLQLGLFFKGIGLSMQDALALWQAEFMQGGKTAEAFEKQYTYDFMHQYGQAGSHKNYQPHACGKVIGASLDPSGATGCPFKNCKAGELASMLRGMKVADATANGAMKLAQDGHYQLACSAVYEGLHGQKLEVTAPHQFFAESRKHYMQREAETNEGDEHRVDRFTPI